MGQFAEPLVDRFVPDSIAEPDDRRVARQVVAIALIGTPLALAIATYHAVGAHIALPLVAGTVLLAAGTLLVPVLLRRTGSTRAAALVLSGLLFASTTFLVYLNGGQAFHVLLWSMLVPLSFPFDRAWRRCFWGALVLSVTQYVAVFAATLATGGWEPVLRHGEGALTVLGAASLTGVLALIVVIARTGSRKTCERIEQRDHFQRALLHAQTLSSLGQVTDALVHSFRTALDTMTHAVRALSGVVDDDQGCREDVQELELGIARAHGLRRASCCRRCRSRSNVPIDDALAALEPMVRVLLGGAELRLDLAAGDARTALSQRRLEQLLVNVVLNAAAAMACGGELAVATRVVDAEVVLEVRDDGGGIPATALLRVFEPLFTLRQQAGRAGLGLWVCRSLARDAGGSIDVADTSSAGTTMRVRLPRV